MSRAPAARPSERMVDAAPFAMALLDAGGVIEHVNEAWTAFGAERGADTGCGAGVDYLDVCRRAAQAGDGDAALVETGLGELLAGHVRAFAFDYPCGTAELPRWFQLQAVRLPAGPGALVVHVDVTARVLAEQAARRRVREDALTGLPNRASAFEDLDLELRLARGTGGPLSVLVLDLDGFKNVNDSLGHDLGDLLLLDVASRLAREVEPGELLARLGGDKYTLLVPGCGADRALARADGLRSAVGGAPFDVAGTHLTLTASVGVVTTGGDGASAIDVLRDGDAALHAAKSAGRDACHVFTPELHERVAERLLLANGLRHAIRRRELRLHHQPVVDLRTGTVGGAEALVRWEHPTRGHLSPGAFVPLAEETGLVVPMGRWVLSQATAQAAAWVRQGFTGKVGVNISAQHLLAETLPDDVSDALDLSGLAPEGLIVEITETAVARDLELAGAQLGALRSLGVEVAIDDFGAGYSSLGQLVDLPADVLKLDRRLLPAGDGSPRSQAQTAVVRAVVAAAEALGLLVLAEGVETEAELDVVRSLGCALAQGYLLGRPAPMGEGRWWA